MELLFGGVGLALLIAGLLGRKVTIGGSSFDDINTPQLRAVGVVLGGLLIFVALVLGGRIPFPPPQPSPSPGVASGSVGPSVGPDDSSGPSIGPSASPSPSPSPSTIGPKPTSPPTPPPTVAPASGPWRGMPPTFNLGVDAALTRATGQVYLFRRDQYIRFAPDPDGALPNYPVPIARNWKNMPNAFNSGIDAATRNAAGQIYFFRGTLYVRITDIGQGMDKGYPVQIAANWKGMPAAFNDGIDAAMTTLDGRIYFFNGRDYVRFTTIANGVDAGYPRTIASRWTGLPNEFSLGLDAATVTMDGTVYFFKGDEYVRFSGGATTVDPGYPKKIGS